MSAAALANLPSVLLGQLLLEFVEDPASLARLVEVALGAFGASSAATPAAAARAACLAALAETPLRASRALGDPQLAWARARCQRVELRMYANMGIVRMPGNISGRARLLNGRTPHSNDARAAVVLFSSASPFGTVVKSEWRREGALHRATKDAVAGNDLPAIIVWDIHGSPVRCEWWNAGQLHRGGGRPAVVDANGRFEWWVRGVRHRGGCKWPRPALVTPGGRREWFVGGRRHRTGGLPALVDGGASFERQWFVDGQLHRTDGGPALVGANGRTRAWYVHGVPHRAGGLPAVEDDVTGSFVSYENGVPHRAGGKPAVVRRADRNSVTVEWWVHGRRHRGHGRPAVITVECSRRYSNLRSVRAVRQWWTDGQRQAGGTNAVEESEHTWHNPPLIAQYHIRRTIFGGGGGGTNA